VSGFTDAEGVTHVPGDVVDLPASYKGQKWLEVVDRKVAAPMVPVAPEVEVSEEQVDQVPLLENPQKKPSKKSDGGHSSYASQLSRGVSE
jgi:hypothetical protein